MKKMIFTLALVVSASAVSFGQSASKAQPAKATKTAAKPATKATPATPATPAKAAAKGAELTWDKTTYEFGSIPQGTPATGTFTFKNTGNAPLILSEVKGSCGCTVPEWTKDPVMPGKTGTIKATYNAANPGAFNKSITVTANTENPTSVIYIKGDVAAKQ